jgi:hypothetical protein
MNLPVDPLENPIKLEESKSVIEKKKTFFDLKEEEKEK